MACLKGLARIFGWVGVWGHSSEVRSFVVLPAGNGSGRGRIRTSCGSLILGLLQALGVAHGLRPCALQ